MDEYIALSEEEKKWLYNMGCTLYWRRNKKWAHNLRDMPLGSNCFWAAFDVLKKDYDRYDNKLSKLFYSS